MTNNLSRKIALLTDSCSDISPDDLAEYNIHVVPLRILCEDGKLRTAAAAISKLNSEELLTEKLGAHKQYNLAIANGGAPAEA